ncbi:MAG: tetratricopeptide repeat protein [Candidatus Eisenbacteria bacterium]|uniref:Tetratricopeptide repeat protein n=1 Tax=Eiseniibacteriota bacterium TaxID=2212470 RepID=A0A956NI33_UNCEI|nr:tetratricopeptide repeat protein [Candidatus Eisenbacteria bacterium]
MNPEGPTPPRSQPPEQPGTREAERLFQSALDLPAAERTAFLDARCPTGSPLRAEVEELLSHFDQAGDDFLATTDRRQTVTSELARERSSVGPYPVLGRLGEGGMGEVYRARDPRLDREIAVKVLPRVVADDAEWQAQIQREARLLASLNHPNIATVFSLEEHEGEQLLTMELVHGETLADRLARGPIALGDTLIWLQQVASAIEAAHKKGVVHRDLKPGNVMITDEGRAKVLDFGIASSIRTDSTAGNARHAGTPGYMSPEQIRGEPPDPRTDLFAFGSILYECITGRRAFPGDSVAAVVKSTLEREVDWKALPSSVPDRIVNVLTQCLEKDPVARTSVMARARRPLEEELTQRSHVPTGGAGLESVPNNLPTPLNSFVGRGSERAQIESALYHSRCVTVVGSGGSGKSRLALEVARGSLANWTDGVWLVEFAAVDDSNAVPATIARTLGVPPHAGRSTLDTIATFLEDRHLLLILDNCEHVLELAADSVDQMLRSARGVHVLATSRERLGVSGEHLIPLPSLGLPDSTTGMTKDLGTIRESEAIRLFLERSRSAGVDLDVTADNADVIAEICRSLDGIPLALELAAARVKVLALDELAERLNDRFRILSSGSRTALPRQRTLRATIDWSYDLLEEAERVLFRRLAVFSGGWTLRAAEDVCAGERIEGWQVLDLHTRLVEKSLVELDAAKSEGRTRYRMLESVREYAHHRLGEVGESNELQERHGRYYLQRSEEVATHLRGPEQAMWLSSLENEHDNLRSALSYLVEHDPDAGLRLATALGRFWAVRGHWKEGRRLLRRAIEAQPHGDAGEAMAKAICWAGTLARMDGDIAAAKPLFERSLGMAKEVEDRRTMATALSNLGHLCHMQGDYTVARQRYEECLVIRRELDDLHDIATSLTSLGSVLDALGNSTEAERIFEENLAITRRIGDLPLVSTALVNLGRVASYRGDYRKARELSDEALRITKEIGDRRLLAQALQSRGAIAFQEEDYDTAYEAYSESLALREQLEDRRTAGHSLAGLGYTACLRGDFDLARQHLHDSLSAGRETGDLPGVSYALSGLGYLASELGDLDESERCLDEGLRLALRSGDLLVTVVTLEGLGTVHCGRGDSPAAVRYFAAAETIRDRVLVPMSRYAQRRRESCLDRARADLGDDRFEIEWNEGGSTPIEALVKDPETP